MACCFLLPRCENDSQDKDSGDMGKHLESSTKNLYLDRECETKYMQFASPYYRSSRFQSRLWGHWSLYRSPPTATTTEVRDSFSGWSVVLMSLWAMASQHFYMSTRPISSQKLLRHLQNFTSPHYILNPSPPLMAIRTTSLPLSQTSVFASPLRIPPGVLGVGI